MTTMDKIIKWYSYSFLAFTILLYALKALANFGTGETVVGIIDLAVLAATVWVLRYIRRTWRAINELDA